MLTENDIKRIHGGINCEFGWVFDKRRLHDNMSGLTFQGNSFSTPYVAKNSPELIENAMSSQTQKQIVYYWSTEAGFEQNNKAVAPVILDLDDASAPRK